MNHRIPRRWLRLSWVLAVICLWAVITAGCGTTSKPPAALNLNPYTITLTADPSSPQHGKPAALLVELKGEDPVPKRAEIYLDVKKKGVDERTEVRTDKLSENHYSGLYTFPDAGEYSITVHIVTRTIHQVANRELSVQ